MATLNRAKGQRLATLYSVGWTVRVTSDSLEALFKALRALRFKALLANKVQSGLNIFDRRALWATNDPNIYQVMSSWFLGESRFQMHATPQTIVKHTSRKAQIMD